MFKIPIFVLFNLFCMVKRIITNGLEVLNKRGRLAGNENERPI